MAYRLLIALVATMIVACDIAGDPTIIEVQGTELGPVTLDPIEVGVPAEATWELKETPPTSTVATLTVAEHTAVLQVDVRGTYLVDRSLSLGVSDELSHHFIVRLPGIPPDAVLSAPAQVMVGASVELSGDASVSPERRDLIYQWRLQQRPRDSVVTLAGEQDVEADFVADVAGTYVVGLAVFDGDFWSDEVTRTIEAAP